jgi:aconitate hydratase
VKLLGVKAVIAESFERIHRTNLVGMGVLPLQFLPGETKDTLCLTGQELFQIENVEQALACKGRVTIHADQTTFQAVVRVDTPQEAEYFRNGGILPYVLRELSGQRQAIG